MDQEKQKRFLIGAAYYGVIGIGIYVCLYFLAPPLLPFLFGFLIAWVLRRLITYLTEKLHIRHKVIAAFITAAFYILLLVILLLAGGQLLSVLKDLLPKLPDICRNQLFPMADACIEKIKLFLEQFDTSVAVQFDLWFDNLASNMMQTITSISASALKLISGVAAGTPGMILRIVLTVVSTFYFSLDYERISGFLLYLLPQKGHNILRTLKEKTFVSLKIFLRSYVLIFLLTFAELCTGFLIMQIPYAALLALLVAVVDIMPVLGTGLVLLPWAVIALIIGNFPIALGMLLLYIAMTIIRNIVEPKLVGKQIGLHPLATLISMFVGLQLFGLVGLFTFPVVLSILVQMKNDGILTFLQKKKDKTPKT